MTTTLQDIMDLTGETDIVAATRATYLNVDFMRARIAMEPTMRDRMERAIRSRHIAANPRGRFGLDTVPVEVQDYLHGAVCFYREEVKGLTAHLRRQRDRGLSWDECWGQLPDHLAKLGFSHGDSVMLGVD